jgi:nucleotide-binding universal stress UspA family protein
MRNILLFIDNIGEARNIAKKALKIARQCRANLLLCNAVKAQVGAKLLVLDEDDYTLFEENDEFDIKGLANELKSVIQPEGTFLPSINCVQIHDLSPRMIREIVIRHGVWLVIMGEGQANQPINPDSTNFTSNLINNINCPVLLIPRYFEVSYFNRIAYITDLRYCDLGVIKFLKIFSAQLFVTHVSAPGLPDMEERYAQEILAEEVSVKSNYQKIFLRNIKSKNIQASIDHVVSTVDIKMLALVNKKHQTFERLFEEFQDTPPVYNKLCKLIFPYLNWFNQASFYSK